jgi:prepilin-type N-terminal cleavage/methylation domain-containing protein
MKRCVHFPNGAYRRPSRDGFTLLEICIVLLIIGILLGAMMPSIQSAFVESAVRADARQLSLMVKTAMLRSTDEGRVYVIDLTPVGIDLHPAGEPAATSPAEGAKLDGTSKAEGDSVDSEVSCRLDGADKILVPDPKKAASWIAIPSTSWIFQPGDLCPATQVRLARGNAWLQMDFNALTGNVENESTYFP